MDWLHRILTTAEVRFSARERRVYSALLIRAGISAVKTQNLEDGGLSLVLYRRDLRQLRDLAAQRGLMLPVPVREDGFVRVLAFWKTRPGLPIGACLALLLWVLSTCIVWRVDVICLDNAQGTTARDFVDVAAIREELAAFGVAPGMRLTDLDARRLENRFLIGREDISWMAINRCGTVLSVEVRPAHTASHDEEPSLIAEDGYLCGTNLVADADGRVLSYSVRGGQPIVTAEQFVLRGELLASGIYTSETGDSIGGRAHGEVLAETVRIIETQVPLTQTAVQPTGVTHRSFALCLFGKNVVTVPNLRQTVGEIVTFLETFFKIGKKTGIDGASCGIITDEAISDTTETVLHLPRGTALPVSVRRTTTSEVTTITQTITEQQALRYAQAALDAKEAALGVVRVLSRDEQLVWEDDVLTVTRYVFCVDNIAVEQPFRIKTAS